MKTQPPASWQGSTPLDREELNDQGLALFSQWEDASQGVELEEDPEVVRLRQQEQLAVIVGGLEREAKRRVDRRASIEQRWLEALRRYHGKYDVDTEAKLSAAKTSMVFVNLTASKTDAMVARIYDLMFPTDDRNWAIDPTPVPRLSKDAEAATAKAEELKAQADAQQAQIDEMMASGDPAQMEQAKALEAQMREVETVENQALAYAEQLQAVLIEAKKRADLMEEHIADQLVECNYAAECRDMIDDGCKIGFGVIKGPIKNPKPKARWVETAEGYVRETAQEEAPGAYRVDPWSYFPDPDVRRVQDSRSHFERHFKSRSELRAMAKRVDMDPDAIRQLIKMGPVMGDTPNYLHTLHAISGDTSADGRDRYVIWEYTGPIEGDDLILLARAFDKEDILPEDFDETQEVDPLLEVQVRIWFSQGVILSFALHPLDSGDSIYNAFTIREDEASPYGYGLPDIMKDMQAVLNGAYRMMMDNSGLGAGPQFLVDKGSIEPEDGDWTIRPRKVWKFNATGYTASVPPFQAVNVDTHQQELMNIVQLAAQTIDEVTAMPKIAEGEQGAGVTKTVQGMSMLMNSANVSFRRIVKNFDDNITTPLLTRFYDWNMQFSDRAEIKGDYEVAAKGSSVLLVREMQANNLMLIAQLFGDHPVYGTMIRHNDLLRTIFRALMIQSDDVLLTETEHKKKLSEQQPTPDPRVVVAEMEAQLQREEFALRQQELQAKVEVANMEADSRLRVAELNAQIAVTTKQAELSARVGVENMKQDSEERITAVEVAVANRTGEHAGGNI